MQYLDKLKGLVEQISGDDNDLGPFGMDAATHKRLKVSKLMKRKKVKPKKPQRTKMPYSMANLPSLSSMEGKMPGGLRKRGYLDENVKAITREDSSTDEEGSYKRLIGGYFESVLTGIMGRLPSSFVKKGTKASSSADYYGGTVRGESDNFEWSVRVSAESRERGYTTGDVRVMARVGTKKMSFIVDGGVAPKEFIGDVVSWMTSKEVVRVR